MLFNHLCFNFLCYIHILIWIVVLGGFISKEIAYLNIKFLIPIIFISHILPFHTLTKIKTIIEPIDTRAKINKFEHDLFITRIFHYVKDTYFKDSFQNPLSPQGMLIIGSITSSLAIVYNKFIF